MKTEIIYDGMLTEKMVTILRNLTKVTIDNSLYTKIRDTDHMLELKHSYKEFVETCNVKCHAYFDVVLGGILYTMVVSGPFGMAIVGNPDNMLFENRNDVYLLESPEELSYLKSPMFSNKMKEYDTFITTHMTTGGISHAVKGSISIDYSAFSGSDVWKELDVKRSLLAERDNTEPCMIFKLQDVINLLALFPDEPVTSSPIRSEYQRMILDSWNHFLVMETG